jgi:S-adenosylmethionine synthetase
MIEKVNPSHPDKIADRIAGAMVDLAYKNDKRPKVAIEVLIGHGVCHIIAESSYKYTPEEIKKIVNRIAGEGILIDLTVVPQDEHLANNQKDNLKCGDNGIFKGIPLTSNEILISRISRDIYNKFPTDGKYVLTDDKLIICQSNATTEELKQFALTNRKYVINPLGNWAGGTNVDSGATNRKLGSDMAQSVTGGGLHGKDLSKADVSVNIYAFLKAQETGKVVELSCAIGDNMVDDKPYEEIVKIAREYINKIGGFEKFAEWGLF